MCLSTKLSVCLSRREVANQREVEVARERLAVYPDEPARADAAHPDPAARAARLPGDLHAPHARHKQCHRPPAPGGLAQLPTLLASSGRTRAEWGRPFVVRRAPVARSSKTDGHSNRTAVRHTASDVAGVALLPGPSYPMPQHRGTMTHCSTHPVTHCSTHPVTCRSTEAP